MKREIHLAVSENQLVHLEQTLVREATKVLGLGSASTANGNLPSKYLDNSYKDILNLVVQVKKQRLNLK